MKALFVHAKEDLRTDEVPTPDPTGDQVRVRMEYAGICGSDLHYYFNGANGEFVVREPLIPGHEVSGVVDLDPSGEFAPGTPVTIHPATFGTSEPGIEDRPHLWPGGSYLGSASTWPHTQGGMSQYLLVHKYMLRRLPEDLPLETAALAEPLAVGLHGITLAGGVEGQRVLVSGSGPIGLLLAAGALALGAEEVTSVDVLDGPLSRAKALGVTHTIRSDREEIPEMAYDVVFECSGVAAAITPALKAVRRAGTVVQVGMVPNAPAPINLAPFISKEVTYKGCFRFNQEIDQAIEILAAHPDIASVITDVFTPDQAVEAFRTARDSEASGKVLIKLEDSPEA